MDSILILGASGLLGSYFTKNFEKYYKVFVCEHQQTIDIPEHRKFKILGSDWNDLRIFIIENNIKIVLNTVALAEVDECEKNKELASRLNISFVQAVAEVTNSVGIRHVLVSTDHFYGNKLGKKTEIDPVKLVNFYAKSKYQGEVIAAEINPNTLIVRTNFYGKTSVLKPSFSDWIYNSLMTGEKIGVVMDVHYTPVSMLRLTAILQGLLRTEHIGIFNVACDQVISKYQFALKFAELLGMSKELIKPIKQKQLNLIAARPRNMELDNAKIKNHLELKNVDYEADLEEVSLTYLDMDKKA